jgi:hypothetical protein
MSAQLPGGKTGVQQYAWDEAVAADRNQPAPAAVSFMPAVDYLNRAEDKYGPYAVLYGGPEYKEGAVLPAASPAQYVEGRIAPVSVTQPAAAEALPAPFKSTLPEEALAKTSTLELPTIAPALGMGAMAAENGVNGVTRFDGSEVKAPAAPATIPGVFSLNIGDILRQSPEQQKATIDTNSEPGRFFSFAAGGVSQLSDMLLGVVPGYKPATEIKGLSLKDANQIPDKTTVTGVTESVTTLPEKSTISGGNETIVSLRNYLENNRDLVDRTNPAAVADFNAKRDTYMEMQKQNPVIITTEGGKQVTTKTDTMTTTPPEKVYTYGQWDVYAEKAGDVVKGALGFSEDQYKAFGENIKSEPGLQGDIDRTVYGGVGYITDKPLNVLPAIAAGAIFSAGGEVIGSGLGALAEAPGAVGTVARVATTPGTTNTIIKAAPLAYFGALGTYDVTEGFTAPKEKIEENVGRSAIPGGAMIAGGIGPSIAASRITPTYEFTNTGPMGEDAVLGRGGRIIKDTTREEYSAIEPTTYKYGGASGYYMDVEKASGSDLIGKLQPAKDAIVIDLTSQSSREAAAQARIEADNYYDKSGNWMGNVKALDVERVTGKNSFERVQPATITLDANTMPARIVETPRVEGAQNRLAANEYYDKYGNWMGANKALDLEIVSGKDILGKATVDPMATIAPKSSEFTAAERASQRLATSDYVGVDEHGNPTYFGTVKALDIEATTGKNLLDLQPYKGSNWNPRIEGTPAERAEARLRNSDYTAVDKKGNPEYYGDVKALDMETATGIDFIGNRQIDASAIREPKITGTRAERAQARLDKNEYVSPQGDWMGDVKAIDVELASGRNVLGEAATGRNLMGDTAPVKVITAVSKPEAGLAIDGRQVLIMREPVPTYDISSATAEEVHITSPEDVAYNNAMWKVMRDQTTAPKDQMINPSIPVTPKNTFFRDRQGNVILTASEQQSRQNAKFNTIVDSGIEVSPVSRATTKEAMKYEEVSRSQDTFFKADTINENTVKPITDTEIKTDTLPIIKTASITDQLPDIKQDQMVWQREIPYQKQTPYSEPVPGIPSIPLPVLPNAPGGGGGAGGSKNPYNRLQVETFSYAPRSIRGLFGQEKKKPARRKKS